MFINRSPSVHSKKYLLGLSRLFDESRGIEEEDDSVSSGEDQSNDPPSSSLSGGEGGGTGPPQDFVETNDAEQVESNKFDTSPKDIVHTTEDMEEPSDVFFSAWGGL